MPPLKRAATGSRPRSPTGPRSMAQKSSQKLSQKLSQKKIGATARTFRRFGRPLFPGKFETAFPGPLLWARSGPIPERPWQPPNTRPSPPGRGPELCHVSAHKHTLAQEPVAISESQPAPRLALRALGGKPQAPRANMGLAATAPRGIVAPSRTARAGTVLDQ